MNVQFEALSENLSSSQKEAYINEYKGLLFEYLVAKNCLDENKIDQFYLQIPPHFLVRLHQAQEALRFHDIALYNFLNTAAHSTSEMIKNNLQKRSFEEVILEGKLRSDYGPNNRVKSECDILLLDSHRSYPLSLKFCKKNSFVNTKSGGVKTFLGKYFAPFLGAQVAQKELNQVVEESFSHMAYKLHQLAGIAYDGVGFSTEFKNKYSELPGEVPAEFQKIILQFYHCVVKVIFFHFKSMANEDFELFCANLLPLCGLLDPHLSQVICHYQKSHKNYSIGEIKWQDLQFFQNELKGLKFQDLKEGNASFEILTQNNILQIRVKPMNVYTVPGLKVNCSLKDFN